MFCGLVALSLFLKPIKVGKLRGSKESLYSMERVTQGDPLSMSLYAIGMLPLICHLKSLCSCTQIWYADDASACDTLDDLFHRGGSRDSRGGCTIRDVHA